MGKVFYKQAKVPVIRKLFRRSHAFICGICRSDYRSREEANNCLNQCWYQIKAQYPLIVKHDQRKKPTYRCHYCFRVYQNEKDGLVCADLCMEKQEQSHIFEQLTNDLPIETRPKRQFRLVKIMPSDISKSKDVHEKIEDEIPSETQGELEAVRDAPAEMTAAEQVEEPAEPPIVKKHRREFQDHWARDGAKYKCRYCQELYYTKVEVEACFESHFDEEGLELHPSE